MTIRAAAAQPSLEHPLRRESSEKATADHESTACPRSFARALGGALLALTTVLALPATSRAEHLEFVEAQKEGVDGVDGLAGILSIALSADGKYVYAAGPSDDAVAVFRRDKATGGLTQVQIVRDGVGAVRGLNFASALAISPDGAHVYVTSWPAVLASARTCESVISGSAARSPSKLSLPT